MSSVSTDLRGALRRVACCRTQSLAAQGTTHLACSTAAHAVGATKSRRAAASEALQDCHPQLVQAAAPGQERLCRHSIHGGHRVQLNSQPAEPAIVPSQAGCLSDFEHRVTALTSSSSRPGLAQHVRQQQPLQELQPFFVCNTRANRKQQDPIWPCSTRAVPACVQELQALSAKHKNASRMQKSSRNQPGIAPHVRRLRGCSCTAASHPLLAAVLQPWADCTSLNSALPHMFSSSVGAPK